MLGLPRVPVMMMVEMGMSGDDKDMAMVQLVLYLCLSRAPCRRTPVVGCVACVRVRAENGRGWVLSWLTPRQRSPCLLLPNLPLSFSPARLPRCPHQLSF